METKDPTTEEHEFYKRKQGERNGQRDFTAEYSEYAESIRQKHGGKKMVISGFAEAAMASRTPPGCAPKRLVTRGYRRKLLNPRLLSANPPGWFLANQTLIEVGELIATVQTNARRRLPSGKPG